MRILHIAFGTLVVIFLTTCTATQTNAQRFPDGIDVALMSSDALKVDPSKFKFLLARCDAANNISSAHGVVDKSLDLSDDGTARQLLQIGIEFVVEKCPAVKYPYAVVRYGDPSTFTDARKGFEFTSRNLFSHPWDVVEGGLRPEKPGLIVSYENWPQALKKNQAYEAEQERQRNADLEAERQAKQRAAARFAAFMKANHVKQAVSIDELTANPFVFQGQIVAIGGVFERMNTPTQGIFSNRGYRFVVSGISTARFTRTGSGVVLAGRVLGNIEVKPGPTMVPHLSFVAIYAGN